MMVFIMRRLIQMPDCYSSAGVGTEGVNTTYHAGGD